MKRKIVRMVATILLIAAIFASPAWAQDQGVSILIDGQQVSFLAEDGLGVPFIQSGRTMIPLRKPLESIGASVSYDSINQTVLINKDNTEISIVVDGGMFINGSAYRQMDAPAMLKDGRVYVPIRHILEVLGYSVSWDQKAQTVTATKTGQPIETVKGWSVPSPAGGALGLGMTDDIGVLTDFPFYTQTISLANQEQISELKTVSVGIRNFSSVTSGALEPITFEYQVYKRVNGKEELVYHKTFPSFKGTLPALSGTVTETEIGYWGSSTIAQGEYVIKLAHPEYFYWVRKGGTEAEKIPVADNIFGESVTIQIN